MILNFLFSVITGENKITWLSIQFNRWQRKKHKETVMRHKSYRKDELYFNVPGAGEISISNHAHSSTGNVVGFSFGCTWGRHGLLGGVLGRDEAKRLSEFLISEINKCPLSMEEELKERRIL